MTITINLQLEIIPPNKVVVPGCESASAISSPTLAMYMSRLGTCKRAVIDVDQALIAIPGSYIKFGKNDGGRLQKWLVLPPITPSCPCTSHEDYYKILREYATTEAPVEEKFDQCNIIGMGFDPSPDFERPTDPYQSEGSFPVEGGRLPPIPPWVL